MKYAIIKVGPFQYNVEEGKEYTTPNFEAEVAKKFVVEEVLAIGDGDKLELGMPFIKGAKVELEILGQEKGEKVTSRIFKAKSRYRRTSGFRKQVTKFKVVSIKY
jgi:large subunit ribosomal protein L21